ncbi:MAG: hypothetical protein RR387_06865 [Clostridiales bacterium]
MFFWHNATDSSTKRLKHDATIFCGSLGAGLLMTLLRFCFDQSICNKAIREQLKPLNQLRENALQITNPNFLTVATESPQITLVVQSSTFQTIVAIS